MLYALLIIASLCSNYTMAMKNESTIKNKDGKILTIKEDHAEIAKEKGWDKEGYMLFGDEENPCILPVSEIHVSIPIGKDGCFMALPYADAMSVLKQREMYELEKNKNIIIENK